LSQYIISRPIACESFNEIVICLEGPHRALILGGSARQIGKFAFCAMFELMYFWMYMRYPNNNLEYGRIDFGDSNNTYRKTLQFKLRSCNSPK